MPKLTFTNSLNQVPENTNQNVVENLKNGFHKSSIVRVDEENAKDSILGGIDHPKKIRKRSFFSVEECDFFNVFITWSKITTLKLPPYVWYLIRIVKI